MVYVFKEGLTLNDLFREDLISHYTYSYNQEVKDKIQDFLNNSVNYKLIPTREGNKYCWAENYNLITEINNILRYSIRSHLLVPFDSTINRELLVIKKPVNFYKKSSKNGRV